MFKLVVKLKFGFDMFHRSSNPHSVSVSNTTVSVTRAELDQEAAKSSFEADRDAVNSLNSMLKRSLDIPDVQDRPAKRRKTEGKDDNDPALFRLFSRQEPRQISLKVTPKVVKKIVSKEPAYEDTEAEAEERARKARAVAVDIIGLLSESPLLETRPSADPPMVVVESLQPLRKTRPPVSPSLLVHHPYSERGGLDPQFKYSAKACPVVTVPGPEPRRERARKVRHVRQPTFWTPPPGCRNKCKGYAMGYPSSWGKYVRKIKQKEFGYKGRTSVRHR